MTNDLEHQIIGAVESDAGDNVVEIRWCGSGLHVAMETFYGSSELDRRISRRRRVVERGREPACGLEVVEVDDFSDGPIVDGVHEVRGHGV